MKIVLPFVAFAFFAVPAASAPAVETGRMIEMELRDGDNLIAAPAVKVEIGRSTTLTAGAYSLRVRMDRTPGGGEDAPFIVRSNLYSAASNWSLVATPAVTVAAGGSGEVDVVGRDGRRLSLAITVR